MRSETQSAEASQSSCSQGCKAPRLDVVQDHGQISAAKLQQGRVYASIAEETIQDTKVIADTLLIHIAHVTILFDSCSTHTFIAR